MPKGMTVSITSRISPADRPVRTLWFRRAIKERGLRTDGWKT